MDKINGYGWIAGIATWLGLVAILAFKTSCARFNGCGPDDLMLNAIVSIGMLAPCWFVASVISAMVKK